MAAGTHRNGCGKAAAQDSQQKGSRACAAAVTKLRPASVRCGAEFFVSVLRRAAPERRASNAQRMTEVAATDEVDVGYTLHDRRCGRCRSPFPAAAYVIPCFQFSMLLHNLSSIFSLGKKASQRALRCTRVPHRTAATTRQPKASTTPAPAESARRTVPDQKLLPHPHIPPVGTPPCSAAPAPARSGLSALKQVLHTLSTEFSTFSPVSHSGFLAPWLSLRETG